MILLKGALTERESGDVTETHNVLLIARPPFYLDENSHNMG